VDGGKDKSYDPKYQNIKDLSTSSTLMLEVAGTIQVSTDKKYSKITAPLEKCLSSRGKQKKF
jgi:hypothetical protein